MSGLPVGLVMGHEFAGTVIDAGDRKDLKIGDKITDYVLAHVWNVTHAKVTTINIA